MSDLKFDNKQLKACLKQRDRDIEMLKQQRNVLIRVIDSEFTTNGHLSDCYVERMLRCAFIVEDEDKWHADITSMPQLIKHLYKNQEKTNIKLYERHKETN